MKFNKKTKYIALCLLLISSISIPVFTFVYFNKNSEIIKYNKSIHTDINKINKVNEKISSYNVKSKFNASKCRENLPNNIKDLLSAKNNLEKYAASEKCKDMHSNLIKAVTSNIYVYEQLWAILNNPESQDVDNAFSSFKKYKDQSIQFYESFNNNNRRLKIDLNKDFLGYLNLSTVYIQELANLQKDKDIKTSQYTDYFNSIDDILTSFLEVRKDFSYYKDKIHDESISIDELSNEISVNKKELQDLKTDVSKISVPSNGINCYILLSKTLDDYMSYIHSFEDDISKNAISSNSKGSNLYSQSDVSYKIMNNTYNDFVKYYSNFKNASKE